MAANADHVKVRFKLTPDVDGWPPVESEGLWALPLGDGRYKIDNTPWFVRGLSAEDIIEAFAGTDGVLWATRRLEWGGRLTIRVIPFRLGPLQGDRQAVLDVFAPLGVSGEGIEQYGIVALDVPPEAPIGQIKTLLTQGRTDGRWDYEEGSVSPAWLTL